MNNDVIGDSCPWSQHATRETGQRRRLDGMAHHFVVACADASEKESTVSIWIPITGITLTLMGVGYQHLDSWNNLRNFHILCPQLMVIFFLFIAIPFIFLGVIKKESQRYCLSIYRTGVQLSRINPTTSKKTVIQYIPRENVVDCVTIEVILAHRVANAVVIRCRGSNIMDAFPEVDFKYTECLLLSEDINRALREGK